MSQATRPPAQFKSLYSYSPGKSKSNLKRLPNYRAVFRKNSKYVWGAICFCLILLLLFVFYVYVLKSSLFKVSTVEIVGASKFVSTSDLNRVAMQNLEGDYIFQIDEASLSRVLKHSFLGIKEVSITVNIPSKVVIQVQEREPLAIVFNPKDSEHFLVDIEGYILGTVSPEYQDLPQVIYNGPLHVGGFIDKDLIPLYLSLISSIEETELKASSISIEKRNINFYVSDKIRVYLNRQRSISESIRIVDQVFTQLSLEGRKIARIDLRYDKVVVEYDED